MEHTDSFENIIEEIFEGLLPLSSIAAVIVTVIGIVIIVIFIARYHHKERVMLIEKGINPLTAASPKPVARSLFWGLLLVGLGLAGFIANFLVKGMESGAVLIFLMMFFSGAAMLIYWRITKPQREKALAAS